MAERIEVLDAEEVMQPVYEKLTTEPFIKRIGDGKITEKFTSISIILKRNEDYHRTDTCYFSGDATVIGPGIVLVIGKTDGQDYLRDFGQGIAVGYIKEGEEHSRRSCEHAIWPCGLGLFTAKCSGLLEYHLGYEKKFFDYEIRTEPAGEDWRIAKYQEQTIEEISRGQGSLGFRSKRETNPRIIVEAGKIPKAVKDIRYQKEVIWDCLARLLQIIETNKPTKEKAIEA